MSQRAVILAGGRGQRLAPYTAVLPKPLMPLLENQSIIEHVLAGVRRAGIVDVTVTLGYLGHLIEAVVGDGSTMGLNVSYTREQEPLGTAGPLALLLGVEPEDDILVVNGDTFTDLNFQEVLACLEAPVEAVVTCVERTIETNYGIVHADDEGSLTGYDEKPTMRMTVSTGIYGLKGAALKLVPAGERYDMPELLMALHDRGSTVKRFVATCDWKDLGRPEDFTSLQREQRNQS